MDWILWEEVGSRGLDTWTRLPAMYAILDGSGSEPDGGTSRTGIGGRCALLGNCRHHLEARDCATGGSAS